MKKPNLELINARMQDVQSVVANARYLEHLEMEGTKPEEVISEAKKVLGIKPEGSVIAEAHDAAVKLNILTRTFLDTNQLIYRLLDQGVSVEDLQKVEKELAEKIMEAYDISEEQLYLEKKEV